MANKLKTSGIFLMIAFGLMLAPWLLSELKMKNMEILTYVPIVAAVCGVIAGGNLMEAAKIARKNEESQSPN